MPSAIDPDKIRAVREAAGLTGMAVAEKIGCNRVHYSRLQTGKVGCSYDMARKPGTGKRAEFCPSPWGGKDWPPAAYSPKTGYLYIPANENVCAWMEGKEVEYRPGQLYMGVDISGGEWT